MMTKQGSTLIVNFMTHGTGILVLGSGHASHTVKCMHDFLENLLLYFGTWNRQIKYKVIMCKEGSTKIENVLTPRQRLL